MLHLQVSTHTMATTGLESCSPTVNLKARVLSQESLFRMCDESSRVWALFFQALWFYAVSNISRKLQIRTALCRCYVVVATDEVLQEALQKKIIRQINRQKSKLLAKMN